MTNRLLLLLATVIGLTVAPAFAQTGGATPATTEQAPAEATTKDAAVAQLEARIAALTDTSAYDESTRKAATDLLNEALAARLRSLDAQKRADESRRQIDQAPGQLEAIREELSRPTSDAAPEIASDASVAQLESMQAQVQADLKAARDLVNELQSESNRRQERRSQIPDLIAQTRQRLSDVIEDIDGLASSSPNGIVGEARVSALTQRREALEAEINALEAEITSYDARRDLLPARRDRALRRVSEKEKLLEKWQVIVSDRRQAEAAKVQREAERLRRQAARQHSVLSEYAKENEQLAVERASETGISSRINTAQEEIRNSTSAIAQLRREYGSLKRRLDASGLNRATGRLLRQEYDKLQDPSLGELKRRLRVSQQQLEDAEYMLIERQEQQVGVGDIDREVNELLSRIEASGSTENRQDFEQVARELAIARRDLLNTLVNDASRHFELLVELNETRRTRIEATQAFQKFIEERILWVRSIAGERDSIADGAGETISWLFNGDAWANELRGIGAMAVLKWPLTALATAVLIVLFAIRRMCIIHIRHTAQLVSNYRTDSYRHTLASLGLTLAASLHTPALLWVIGWLIALPTTQTYDTSVALSLGDALRRTAYFLLPLTFINTVMKPRGLADAHFRWPLPALKAVRFHLRWFIPTVVPLVALGSTIRMHGDDLMMSTVGRVLFSAGMLALAAVIFRMLRPNGPLLTTLFAKAQESWTYRLRFAWWPLLVLVPLSLIVASWLGYHYTALQLELRLESTIVLLLVITIASGMLARWLFVARRQVAVEDARRRREQAVAEEKSKAEQGSKKSQSPTISEQAAAPLDEDKLDLPSISAQSRQLFRAVLAISVVLGLAAIWADVLPALRMLDRVEIWPQQRVLEISDDDSIPILETAGLATASTPVAAAPSAGQSGSPSSSDSGNGSSTPFSTGSPIPLSTTTGVGEASSDTGEISITLADIGLSIVALIVTFVCFQNLPGLVEMLLLQRLPLAAGSRYAISTVLRYAIAGVGIVVAFNSIGISWSKVQWLAAALTFGLAFGLQEIFANFISGLIILAERPIRLGDTVTVNGTTGTVTRIKMRATTITDWDRKELVIPNKTFITGDVINWTLGDPVLRIKIPVGVSYSSDVDLVEKTLRSIAKKNKLILDDPAPQVVFNSFADSTLNFEMRVFIPHIEHWLRIIHEMHMTILKEFRKAGIEIAFPQRDLHLRSSDALLQFAQKRENLEKDDAGSTEQRHEFQAGAS